MFWFLIWEGRQYLQSICNCTQNMGNIRSIHSECIYKLPTILSAGDQKWGKVLVPLPFAPVGGSTQKSKLTIRAMEKVKKRRRRKLGMVGCHWKWDCFRVASLGKQNLGKILNVEKINLWALIKSKSRPIKLETRNRQWQWWDVRPDIRDNWQATLTCLPFTLSEKVSEGFGEKNDIIW